MAKQKVKTKSRKQAKPKISEAAPVDTEKIKQFTENMKKIIDPHTGINIVDMGMVQNIAVKGGKVSTNFIPTSPFCPVVNYFVDEIKKAAKHAGFSDCEVNLKI
jgi:metal-sulfur cluster biosynthetic enzyme